MAAIRQPNLTLLPQARHRTGSKWLHSQLGWHLPTLTMGKEVQMRHSGKIVGLGALVVIAALLSGCIYEPGPGYGYYGGPPGGVYVGGGWGGGWHGGGRWH